MRRSTILTTMDSVVDRYINNDYAAVIDVSKYLTQIDNVSGDLANVDTVAGSIGNVNAVGTNIAAVTALNGIITELLSLYADKTTLDSLFADKATLDSLFADKAKLDSLYADKATLDSLFADKAVLDSLYADKAVLDSIYADKTALDSIYADKTALDALYANLTELIAVYTNLADVVTVAGIAGDVTTVAGSAADVNLIADHIDGTVSTDVTTVADNIVDINNVAANIADVNNFADTYYGSLAVEPTIVSHPTLSVGDLYYDTVAEEMRVYSGGLWKAAGSTVNGILRKELYVVSTSTTVFNVVGGYDSGYVHVYVNGIKLQEGVDFTETDSNTTVTLTSPVGEDIEPDIVDIVAYGSFQVAGSYTKEESDVLHRSVPMKVKAVETLVPLDCVKGSGYNAGENATEVVKTVAQTDICIGIVSTGILNGSFGDVVTKGLIEGVDTSAWSFGTILYSAGSGGLTANKPSGAYQAVAYVVRVSATVGAVMVDIGEPVSFMTTTNNYTAPQRSAETVDNDGSFDLSVAQNFSCTPTGTFALTFTNIPADEQSGTILLDNSGGHVVTKDTAVKVDANFLTTVSTAGVYIIGYRTKDTVVYCYNTGALS